MKVGLDWLEFLLSKEGDTVKVARITISLRPGCFVLADRFAANSVILFVISETHCVYTNIQESTGGGMKRLLWSMRGWNSLATVYVDDMFVESFSVDVQK
ncbi:hypothetical protein ACFE04_023510 [Oxalis oulophora]